MYILKYSCFILFIIRFCLQDFALVPDLDDSSETSSSDEDSDSESENSDAEDDTNSLKRLSSELCLPKQHKSGDRKGKIECLSSSESSQCTDNTKLSTSTNIEMKEDRSKDSLSSSQIDT